MCQKWRKRLCKEGVEQAAAGGGGLVEAGFQLVADCHQDPDFVDDAVLFSERGNGTRKWL